ncbi:MAG: V-type ATPase subunit [Thermoplasmatota archaeon]|nr:V-type ATPase subunit [Halobacteriales archaeon]
MAMLARGSSNYPYAVSRVQAKRSKLLPPSEFEKVLKMDVAEITRYIEESVYKEEVDELATKFQGLDLLEAALTVNEERTYESVRQMVTGEGGLIVNSYLDRFHFEDVKTLLRGKQAGASRDELLREMVLENQATYDLFAPLLSEDVKSPADVVAALQAQGGQARDWANILAAVPAGSPLPRYEDALDKAYFDRLLGALKSSKQRGAREVLDFVRREIDARNLLNAARWVAAGEQGDFAPFVVPGGKSLPVSAVMALSKSKDLEALAEGLADVKTFAAVRDDLAKAKAAGRLGTFQSAVWRAHLKELDHLSHLNPLSVIPILVFLIRKHREVVTLRAVARGKAAGLSEARLQELIV